MGKSSTYRGVTLFRPTGKWRAQISAGGKTTSLGDHDTEQEAARSFDRAAINKHGVEARTNFDVEGYAGEVAELQGMTQSELVAMLRSKARKSGTQTSLYRGVSLLKQTGKWHAQINVGGKQVHLGFFSTEEQAARAYDRAAINKGARDSGKIITNFDLADYARELDMLHKISQDQLVAALANEQKRRAAMELLNKSASEDVFGRTTKGPVGTADLRILQELSLKAERAQPKPTASNPQGSGQPVGSGTNTSRPSSTSSVARGSAQAAAAASRARAKRRRQERASPSSQEEDISSMADDSGVAVSSDTESDAPQPKRRSTRQIHLPARLTHSLEAASPTRRREEAGAPLPSSPGVLIEGTASHAVRPGSPSALDLAACAQLSPATPPSSSQAAAQQVTPQSKLRTQQLLHPQPVPGSPPPAAAPGSSGLGLYSPPSSTPAAATPTLRPQSATSDSTPLGRSGGWRGDEVRTPVASPGGRENGDDVAGYWRSSHEQLQERAMQGKPLSRRQEALAMAQAQRIMHGLPPPPDAPSSVPAAPAKKEVSDTPAASALARLHASDSELPSDEHEDGSRAGRELTPGTDVVRKNRRTIRRPERAAA